MQLNNLYKEEERSKLNLVLLLARSLDEGVTSINTQEVKMAYRAFYNNRKSVVGQKYHKPISRIINVQVK